MNVVAMLSELRAERQQILVAIQSLERVAGDVPPRFKPIPFDSGRRRRSPKPKTISDERTVSFAKCVRIFPRGGHLTPK